MLNAIKFHFSLLPNLKNNSNSNNNNAISESILSEIDKLGDKIRTDLNSNSSNNNTDNANNNVYGSCVDTVLAREVHWATWKKEGCSEEAFKDKLPSLAVANSKSIGALANEKIVDNDKMNSNSNNNNNSNKILFDENLLYLEDNGNNNSHNKRKRKVSGFGTFKLGDASLDRLWNSVDNDNKNSIYFYKPDDIKNAKEEEKKQEKEEVFCFGAAPAVDEFLEKVYEQAHANVPEDEKLINDDIFQWKAARLLSRSGRKWPLGIPYVDALERGLVNN